MVGVPGVRGHDRPHKASRPGPRQPTGRRRGPPLGVGHPGHPLEGWLRLECPDFHLANAHIHPPPPRLPLERPATPPVHDLPAWRSFVAHLMSLPRSAMSNRALQKFWRLRESGGPCFLLISTFSGYEGLEMGMPERPGLLRGVLPPGRLPCLQPLIGVPRNPLARSQGLASQGEARHGHHRDPGTGRGARPCRLPPSPSSSWCQGRPPLTASLVSNAPPRRP